MFSKWNPGWLAQLLQVALAARGHSSAPGDATDGGKRSARSLQRHDSRCSAVESRSAGETQR